MSAKIPNGSKYVENASHGIATGGGSVCFGGTLGVFVECIECSRRDAIQGKFGCAQSVHDRINALTDDEASHIFVEHGWTVEPTLCPEHSAPVVMSRAEHARLMAVLAAAEEWVDARHADHDEDSAEEVTVAYWKRVRESYLPLVAAVENRRQAMAAEVGQ